MLKEGTKKGGKNERPSCPRPNRPPLGQKSRDRAVDILSINPAEFKRLLRRYLPEVLPELIKRGTISLRIT